MNTKAVDIQDVEGKWQEVLAWVREGTEVLLVDGGTPVARIFPVVSGRRIAGLHEHLGHAWISDDFNDPLPDELWLGEDEMD